MGDNDVGSAAEDDDQDELSGEDEGSDNISNSSHSESFQECSRTLMAMFGSEIMSQCDSERLRHPRKGSSWQILCLHLLGSEALGIV